MNKDNKNYILFGAVVIAVFGLVILLLVVSDRGVDEKMDSDVQISASTYTLGHFAKQVGGDKVNVVDIGSSGISPHDFDPSPRDLAAVYKTDLFIYHGAGLDPWAERIAPDVVSDGVLTLEMSDNIEMLEASPLNGVDEVADDEHDLLDPHFWLDPLIAVREVELIKDELININIANKDTYEANAAAYIEKLQSLDAEYTSALNNCASRDIIVSHDAFSYLGERYDINIESISGISPDEEPSAKRLGELAGLAADKGIQYIFFETMVSPRLAETLAEEVSASTLILNPIGSLVEKEREAGSDYISIMQSNLDGLILAMGCEVTFSGPGL